MKRLLVSLLLVCLAGAACAQPVTTFVFVKITEPLQPIARGAKYVELGAPKGGVLQYEVGGRQVEVPVHSPNNPP